MSPHSLSSLLLSHCCSLKTVWRLFWTKKKVTILHFDLLQTFCPLPKICCWISGMCLHHLATAGPTPRHRHQVTHWPLAPHPASELHFPLQTAALSSCPALWQAGRDRVPSQTSRNRSGPVPFPIKLALCSPRCHPWRLDPPQSICWLKAKRRAIRICLTQQI